MSLSMRDGTAERARSTGRLPWTGALGTSWLWFRLGPVPARLDDPLAPGRWALIGAHVALIAIGLALAATALLD